ncbi:hypothetical protein [Microbacterium sp. LWS13-1.2]|uniref:Uncharacterized protein n=1 Tax=Microbacterium sp. LWS13-1.2 TaxID=3135264 RepID=A0AAU6S6M8_9MICO
MLLNFKTITCARCGGERIMSVACPDCGAVAPSGEVDSNVVRRRQGLARVKLKRVEAEGDVHARPDSNGLSELLREMLAALGAFSRAPLSEETITRLARALAAIDVTQKELAVRAGRRPGIGLTRAREESVARLDSVWQEYEEALVAPTPAQAQAAAKRAQALMNTAADPIVAAGRLERAASILEDESQTVPVRVLNVLEERFPDTPFLEVLSTGRAYASNQLGIAVGPNSGLSYLLLESIAARSLNPDRFREKLRICAAGAHRPERLTTIASMDGAVQALSETHRLVMEAAIAYGAAIAKDGDDRSVVRRTGRLMSEMYESGGAAFGWYRLLEREVSAVDAFARQQEEDVTAVVAKLQNGPLSAVFADAERFLRNAPNHGRSFDFDPDSQRVLIRLRSHPETAIELDDYVDRAFAFLETLLASIWGLENALELACIEVSLSEADALYLGFSPLALAAATLPRLTEMTVERFRADGDTWYFDVTTAQPDLLVPAISIASIPRVDAKEIVLRVANEPELTVSLSSWRELGVGDDPNGKMMSLLRVKWTSSLEGEPVLTETDVQFLLLALGKGALEGDMSTVRHLRQIRSWSADRGWVREAELSTRLIAATRGIGVESLRDELVTMAAHAQVPKMPVARAIRVLVDL